MSEILTITKKELKTYLITPLFYIILFVLLLMAGLDFYGISVVNGNADIRLMLFNQSLFLLLIIPIITMRLIAEEKRRKTIELIVSFPISLRKIIVGKFISASLILFAILFASLPHLIFLFIFGNPEIGIIISVYIGMLLYGLSLISIGLLVSTLCESQIAAVIVSLIINLFFYLSDFFSSITFPPFSILFTEISPIQHLSLFFQGLIPLQSIFFFLLLICMPLLIAMNYFYNEKQRN